MDNNAAQEAEAKVGVETQASPAQGQGQAPAPQSESVNKPVQTPENLPFDKHPRWQELQKERKRDRQELESLRKQYQELKGYQDGMNRSKNQGQELSPDDEGQLMRLVELMSSSPKVMEKLGITKISQLEKQFGELSENWHGSQYETEMNRIKDYVKNLGLDPEEVESDLREHIENHPVFSQMSYYKGAVEAAFRDKYWDKVGELRERADNRKKLEEKEALKRGQTQTTSESATKGKSALSKDPQERMKQLIAEAGGMENIDFTR